MHINTDLISSICLFKDSVLYTREESSKNNRNQTQENSEAFAYCNSSRDEAISWSSPAAATSSQKFFQCGRERLQTYVKHILRLAVQVYVGENNSLPYLDEPS